VWFGEHVAALLLSKVSLSRSIDSYMFSMVWFPESMLILFGKSALSSKELDLRWIGFCVWKKQGNETFLYFHCLRRCLLHENLHCKTDTRALFGKGCLCSFLLAGLSAEKLTFQIPMIPNLPLSKDSLGPQWCLPHPELSHKARGYLAGSYQMIVMGRNLASKEWIVT